MTFEIDPDFALGTRLVIGRRWPFVIPVAALPIFIAALLRINTPTWQLEFKPWLYVADPYTFAMLLVVAAATLPVVRLADLERRGLVDHMRLCGRTPLRTLVAFVAGSTWPFLLIATVLLVIGRLWLPGEWASVWFIALLAVSAADLQLIAISVRPSAGSSQGLIFAMIIGVVAAFAGAVGFMFGLNQVGRSSVGAALFAVAVLPPALWIASRALTRPRSARRQTLVSKSTHAFARFASRGGPPEFWRRLRSAIGLVSVPVVILQLAMAAAAFLVYSSVGPDATRAYARLINIVPYMGLPVVAFAMSITVRQEIESRTIDLVRLTPQRPEAVALSWYVGISLPFWILSLLPALVLRIAESELSTFSWWLPTLALLLPAVSLSEGFDRRPPGTYVVLFLLLSGLIVNPYADMQDIRHLDNPEPWTLQLAVLAPAFTIVVALGAACGRMGRPAGPPLAGAAAAAAIAAVALSLRVVPVSAYPRVVVGLLPLFAVFVAEERTPPTAPWTRLAIVSGTALIAVVTFTAEAGFRAIDAVATGVGGGLAVAIGLLSYELLYRRPAFWGGVAIVTLLVVLRFPAARVPHVVETADLAILIVACAVLAIAHAYSGDRSPGRLTRV